MSKQLQFVTISKEEPVILENIAGKRHEPPDRSHFTCPQCGIVCNNWGHLKFHMQIAHDPNQFSCEQCNFKCNCRGSLMYHMTTH